MKNIVILVSLILTAHISYALESLETVDVKRSPDETSASKKVQFAEGNPVIKNDPFSAEKNIVETKVAKPTTTTIQLPDQKRWFSTTKTSTIITNHDDGSHTVTDTTEVQGLFSNKISSTSSQHNTSEINLTTDGITFENLDVVKEQIKEGKLIENSNIQTTGNKVYNKKDGSSIERSTDLLGNKIQTKYRSDNSKEREIITSPHQDGFTSRVTTYDTNGNQEETKDFYKSNTKIDDNGNELPAPKSWFNLFAKKSSQSEPILNSATSSENVTSSKQISLDSNSGTISNTESLAPLGSKMYIDAAKNDGSKYTVNSWGNMMNIDDKITKNRMQIIFKDSTQKQPATIHNTQPMTEENFTYNNDGTSTGVMRTFDDARKILQTTRYDKNGNPVSATIPGVDPDGKATTYNITYTTNSQASTGQAGVNLFANS